MNFYFKNEAAPLPGHHCENCKHRKEYNGGDWSSEMCDHPKAPQQHMDSNFLTGRVYNNSLQATPEWCPLNGFQLDPNPNPTPPASWMEMVTANLVREGIDKHKARELAEHFYSLAQRQWVGLAEADKHEPDMGPYVYLNDDWLDGYKTGMECAEAKLKEKNNG